VLTCYSNPVKNGGLKNDDENLDFPVLKVKRISINNSVTLVLQNPLPVIQKFRPKVVISEGSPSYLTLWLLLFLKFIFRYKLIIWSHGLKYNEIDNPFKSLRSKIQLWLFNRADALIIYSEIRAALVRKYVNNSYKVFVVRNTLDTEKLKVVFDDLENTGKAGIKREIKFDHLRNIAFIGRLLPNKGLDDLLETYKTVSEKFDVALHIIGDGPERKRLEKAAEGIPGIFFYGAVFDEIITGKILYSSDLMVMPGYVGLSVVHAFAFGCPVVTYKGAGKNGPLHSPEVEYIRDGENGVFCDPGQGQLAMVLTKLFKDPDKMNRMSANSSQTAFSEASILKMIDGFKEVFKYLEYSHS
jgi:glycosyltransferase involved in cell wall biosynthesis